MSATAYRCILKMVPSLSYGNKMNYFSLRRSLYIIILADLIKRTNDNY